MGVSAIAPTRPMRGVLFDEFIGLSADWAVIAQGTGAIAAMLGADANNDAGLGLLNFQALQGGDSASLGRQNGNTVAGRLKIRAHVRLRVRGAPSDLQIRFGVFDPQTNTSYATLDSGDAGTHANWQLSVGSTTGTGSQAIDSGVAVVQNVFHDLVLVIEPGVSVTAYLNGTQIAQSVQANAILQNGDEVQPFVGAFFVANNGGEAELDFYELRLAE